MSEPIHEQPFESQDERRTFCPLCDERSGIKYGGMGLKREVCEWHIGYAAGYEAGRMHGFDVGRSA